MSAFLVDKAHIDALVAAGLRAQRDGQYGELPLSWTAPRRREARRLDHLSADGVGRMLWRENVRSLMARYPGHADEWADAMRAADAYVFPGEDRVERLDLAGELKAIDCLEYQSCEHRGWRTSEARAFCDALRRRLVALLPGYDAAEWGVRDLVPHACEAGREPHDLKQVVLMDGSYATRCVQCGAAPPPLAGAGARAARCGSRCPVWPSAPRSITSRATGATATARS